jgi:hypothetical protein
MLTEKEMIHYDRGPSPNDYLMWNTGGFFELEFSRGSTNTFLFYNNALQKCSLED